MKITLKQFERFLVCQRKGYLKGIEKMAELTGLTRQEIGEIIKNYDIYNNKLKEELGYEVKC